MIYTLLLKPGFKNILRILAFVIIITFSASLYSCQTTEIYNYTPEQLKTDDDISLLEVTTKNDSTIKLGDYDAIYMENYKDSSDILLIEKTNIPPKYTYKPDYKPKKTMTEIKVNNIKNIKVEKSKNDWMATSLFLGAVFATLIIIGMSRISYGFSWY